MRTVIRRLAAVLAVAIGIPVGLAGPAAPAQATICIRTLTVAGDRGYEGTPGSGLAGLPTAFVFTVTSAGCATPSTVRYATQHGTTNAYDLYSSTGTLTFDAGDMSARSIVVWVRKDGSPGPNEAFSVRLSSPSGAIVADGSATGLIINDDVVCVPPPEVPPGADYHCAE